MTFETLTEDERDRMNGLYGPDLGEKALRCIDQRDARITDLERELAEARAEVERLPAAPVYVDGRPGHSGYNIQLTEARQQRAEWAEAINGPNGFRNRLAAANALLERTKAFLDAHKYYRLLQDVEAHLSGQPAAPDPRDAEGVDAVNWQVAAREAQAEVSRLTKERDEAWAEVSRVQQVGLKLEVEVARLNAVINNNRELSAYGVATADMRVLEACAQADVQPGVPGHHDAYIDRGEWRIAAAELARREAKG